MPRRAIGSEGEQLTGPQVQRTKFGILVVAKIHFKVGEGANTVFDAQAWAQASRERDKWNVDNCNRIVEMTKLIRKLIFWKEKLVDGELSGFPWNSARFKKARSGQSADCDRI